MKYRRDIDGLRAVAVLSVVLFHCWPLKFVSGFVGVDIFFVISGYLITTILLSQLETGNFSIFDFYSRRVRRIFPALLVVLAATLGFGWVILLHGEFSQVGKHVAAGGGFVSNLVLWAESGYFDNSAATKPLLHLWSLGVEEQFYFLWPLILWLVFTRRFNFLLITAAIFIASMGLNIGTVYSDPTAAFYSPLSRFWELMVGGVGAYLHMHRAPWTDARKNLASMTGTLLMALAFVLIKPQSVFPGWWALLPVAAAFLLIMAGPAAVFNRYLLSNRFAVSLGLISYPLYLWHWPLLSYAHILYGEKPAFLVKIGLMAGAVALAYLTYRLLEIPLRSLPKRRVVSGLVSGMVTMTALGIAINVGMLRERIDVHGSEIYLNALNDFDFPGATFTPLSHQGMTFQQLKGNTSHLTVFIGDSLMEEYGPRMEQLLAGGDKRYNGVIFATGGGCPPLPHTIRLPQLRFPKCPQSTAAAFDLASRQDVDAVVIGAAWYSYFGASYDELLFDTGTSHLAFPATQASDLAYGALRSAIETLRRQGKRVYLVLQPPSGQLYDPRNMYQGSRFRSIYPLPQIPNLDLNQFLKENAVPRARLLDIASATGAIVIEPSKFLCNGDICPVLDNAVPAYTDALHMRPAYSRKMATYLDQTVLAPADLTSTEQ